MNSNPDYQIIQIPVRHPLRVFSMNHLQVQHKKKPRKDIRHNYNCTSYMKFTREMCLELIEYITLDAYVEGQPRDIYIYYKLLDEPLNDKRSLF